MTKSKCLGIWMDHSSANLMEFSDRIETKILVAETGAEQADSSVLKGESQKHNKQQNMLSSYYKKLGEIIKEYGEVILFGPTNAKTELYNQLQASIHFDHIRIEIQDADKMTENQQHAFVKAYFTRFK